MKNYKTTVGICKPPLPHLSGDWCYYSVTYIPNGAFCFDGHFCADKADTASHVEKLIAKRKNNSSVLQPDKKKVKGKMGIKLNEKNST